MKKLLSILVVIVFAASFTLAQSKNHVSIGANVSVPMGTFSDVAGIGFGGTATYEIDFSPNLTGVATAGYLKFGGKDFSEPGFSYSYSYSDIPIMVGAKYYFTPNKPFYAIAQIGFQIFNSDYSASYDIAGFSYSASGTGGSSTEFAFAVGAGYEIPVGPKNAVDVTGTFNVISNLNYIGARVAYRFSL